MSSKMIFGGKGHTGLCCDLTLDHSSSPAFWNSSRYPSIFPRPVSVGGSHDSVTDSLVKSMTFKFIGGPGLTVEEEGF